MKPSMEQNPEKSSVMMSGAGWIVAVVACAGFLFIAKPHYYTAGYEQGKSDQLDYDRMKVQEYMRLPADAAETVYAKILSIAGDAITFEYKQSQFTNPLTGQETTGTVSVDAKTVYVRRTALTPQQYQASLQRARQEGANVAMVAPYSEKSFALSELKSGDEVYITLVHNADDSLYAKEIDINDIDPNMIAH